MSWMYGLSSMVIRWKSFDKTHGWLKTHVLWMVLKQCCIKSNNACQLEDAKKSWFMLPFLMSFKLWYPFFHRRIKEKREHCCFSFSYLVYHNFRRYASWLQSQPCCFQGKDGRKSWIWFVSFCQWSSWDNDYPQPIRWSDKHNGLLSKW